MPVQPNFEELSCAFARAPPFGAGAGFEVRGLRQALSFFISSYSHTLKQRLRREARQYRLPLLTAFNDRWDWIDGAVVPRFRRFEARGGDLNRALDRIISEAELRGAGAVT